MYYFFLDESYPPSAPEQQKIVMAAWAVEQHRWGGNTASRFDLFNRPILKRICSMLEALDGSAFVAIATLDASLCRPGEIDSTSDIPSMARFDLVWSMSAVFVLGTLILELLKRNREVATVDIHFDPKSLKSPHSEAWQKTLRELVVKEAKRFASERGLRGNLNKLKIRRVEPVTKSGHLAQKGEKFPMGTWVADKLCSQFNEIESLKDCARIASLDMSESVRRTTQQFDGIPFDDP